MNGHMSGIKSKVDNILYNHFQGPCNLNNISVQPIEALGATDARRPSQKKGNFEKIIG